MDSLKGQLLLAVPELPDNNFFRSVVFVFSHDEMGAAGVILNRPAPVTLADIWQQISDDDEYDAADVVVATPDRCVQIGGPVEGPLIGLHTSLALAESQVIPGVFISMSRENLNSLVTQDFQDFRIYSGYSGWGPGQLDAEVGAGGWLTIDATSEHVFADSEELWKDACQVFGNQIMHTQLGNVATIDPSLN